MSQVFIHISGHLGQDPETRFTPSGQKVTNLRVATNIKRGGKEKTVWWKVTCWGDSFDKMLSYLKKGSAIMVWGEMGIPDIYQDREGNPQTSFEIIAKHLSFSPFGTKSEQQARQGAGGEEDMGAVAMAAAPSARSFGVRNGSAPSDPASHFADDDIPF
jgi:single-strand DNA-binding protein